MNNLKKSAIMIIAGSDSIGGAGVQRDIRTCHQIGVTATNIITCVTAQNGFGVQRIEDVSLETILQQIESIQAEYDITYVKTGMLHKKEIISTIHDFIKHNHRIKLILDPVIIATSGGKLLQDDAIYQMKSMLASAFVVTPNLPEAEILSDIKITTQVDLIQACNIIYQLGAKNVVIKGGHFDLGSNIVTNILFDGHSHYEFSSPRIVGQEFHGSGCMFASAVTSYLFLKHDTVTSIKLASDFVYQSLCNYF